jgi:hypothetical protein
MWLGESDLLAPVETVSQTQGATNFSREVALSSGIDVSDYQPPLFVDRATAVLLDSGHLMGITRTSQWVEDLAVEFDVLDENGRRPPGYARRAELQRCVPFRSS